MATSGSGPAPAPGAASEQQKKEMAAKVANALTVLNARTRSGANWFFLIAGLSLVNTALEKSGANRHFLVGLGITQVVDIITDKLGTTGLVVGVIVNLFVAAFFILLGVMGRKKQKWPFLLGMVLYGLDGLLFLLGQDFFSLGFHGLALYFLYKGLAARNQLEKLEGMLQPAGATAAAAAAAAAPVDISNKPIG